MEERNTRHTKENIAVSVVALDVECTRAHQPFGGRKEGAWTYVGHASWCHAQRAVLCCHEVTLRMGISTNTSPARTTLHAWYAENINMHEDSGYKNSWRRANEKHARAGIRMHTHGHAHSVLDSTETNHIQAAMSCPEKTRIGSGSNGRRPGNTGELRDACARQVT